MIVLKVDFFTFGPFQENTYILSDETKECLIIEDNDNGIKAAKAAGGNLLIVDTVDDVTYAKITSKIREVEKDEYNHSISRQ